MNNEKLNDIVKRLHGDFFISCVGPVRSGKSTFINKFMNIKILPYIDDEYLKNKIVDELPQTAAGKQIMTVEPKFVPSEAINVNIGDINMNLRMVDSVGFVMENALGYESDDGPRLVKTPWFEESIEFKDAARIGTQKIMENHSNLAVVLTSDGSFSEFTREDYEKVEDEIIQEMKSLGKPFVIVLNTKNPTTDSVLKVVEELSIKYNESVYACNVAKMTEDDINEILSRALDEFPIEKLNITLPSYLDCVGDEIPLKADILTLIDTKAYEFKKIKEVTKLSESLKENENVKDITLDLDGADVTIKIELKDECLHMLINELADTEIVSQDDLIKTLYKGHSAMKMYDEVGSALKSCKETGYGVAIPSLVDMKMLPPTVIKQAGRYGVKVEAIAPSIHLIKVDVKSSFSPIIGSLEQSKSLIESLDNDQDNIWDKEIFGRRISEIVNDGIKQKIYSLPETSKEKLKDVMNKLINSNRNSLIAIVL